ncbi:MULTISPECIES: hypothetical protein [Flavobacterium]|uniref:Beta/gamma crystallin 'Greek key' domain-containing protein n=1 Tax=Flavobacterium hankyongi TaxID=1176532 RepID=A0ABP8ZYY8_9FLAO|nr:hypothetical protein [Flavobacterium sp. N1846]
MKLKPLALVTTLFLVYSQYAQLPRSASNQNLKNNTIKSVKKNDILVASFHSKGDEIWFFEHENFQGKRLVLKEGIYTLDKMGSSWNDIISSVLIPENYQVQIFAEDGFKGVTISLDGYWQPGTTNQRWRYEGYPQLQVVPGISYDFNDKISSIQIYKMK